MWESDEYFSGHLIEQLFGCNGNLRRYRLRLVDHVAQRD
jgi:hypothetical protein